MTKEQFEKQDFRIEGVPVDANNALRIWKKMYGTYENFLEQMIRPADHPFMNKIGKYISKEWNSIKDITVANAFSVKNVEVRRLYFKAIGVIQLFKDLDPVLIDTKVLKKKGVRWDENNNEIPYSINDKYELYKIDGNKLYPDESSEWRRQNATIYAVRCWCSTTEREYWIYVPRDIGEKGNALDAIAWTVRISHTNPEYIIRQGDVIIAKLSKDSKRIEHSWRKVYDFKHLTGKEYKNLIIATT